MPGGKRRAVPRVRSGNEQLFGLSARQLPGTGFRRAAGMSPGKIRGNTPVCPAASTPNPNNCSRSPIPKTPNPKIPML